MASAGVFLCSLTLALREHPPHCTHLAPTLIYSVSLLNASEFLFSLCCYC